MEITELLRQAHSGDRQAFNMVVPLVYEELKHLAASHLRRQQNSALLQTTVLVHEAFLRLAGTSLPACESRSHFYGIASRVMRQVLVDFARSRLSLKRGGGFEQPFTDSVAHPFSNDEQFLVLNDALDRLSAESPLKGRLIEMRFFAGLTAEQSADVLSIKVHTVRRELRLAQAWLCRELQPA